MSNTGLKELTLSNLKNDFFNSSFIERHDEFVSFFYIPVNLYFKKLDDNTFLYGTFNDFFKNNIDFDIYSRFWLVEKFSITVFFANLSIDADDVPNKTLSCHDFEAFFNLIIKELFKLYNEIEDV